MSLYNVSNTNTTDLEEKRKDFDDFFTQMEIPDIDWERHHRRGCPVLFLKRHTSAPTRRRVQSASATFIVTAQVNSADVATPGSAPVATQAILESSEFKSLAKNQAFQELMANSDFNALSSQP